MKKSFVRAALAACLLSSAAVLAAAPALAAEGAPTGSAAAPAARASASAGTVSTAVGKLLQPAAKLMEANDYAGALVLVKQAQALPDLAPFDTYKVNEFLGNIYIKQNDHANAEIAYDAMVASDAVPADAKASDLRIAALLSTEQKHFDNGIKYAQAYIALGGPPDTALLSSLSEAYYYSNDFANAETTVQKVIAATPAGQTPNRGALEILFRTQLKANNQEAAIGTLEKMVGYYNDPDEWGQVIDTSIGTKGIKDVEALNIYRLRLATKAPGQEDGYSTPAAIALSLGYPVEAQAYLDAGAGVVSGGGKTGALMGDVRGRAAKDRASLGQFETLVNKTTSGEFDLKLAETYIGYARYADAEATARRALTRGFAKLDHNEANMVLGEALAFQGKNTDAAAAFNDVHNPSAGGMRAQHLWLLYVNRTVAAAPAPAAH